MRIISGKFRGTNLASVGDADGHLRPTSDRVREAIFNLLAHGDYPAIEGVRVLDLFAGTGALGFEALSRGAASVCFVDNGVKAAALIRQNAEKLRVRDLAMLKRDATKLGPNAGDPFGLVFMDPPYTKGLGEIALISALAGGWIAKDATVVWEDNASVTIPLGFVSLDQRSYGDTKVLILKVSGA